MPHWKLTLSYDGTAFHGWQVQPGRPTVQAALAAALHQLLTESPVPQGSGRTDAGVHALAQVASVTTTADLPAANLQRALNRILPPAVRVIAAEVVGSDFHARHSAVAKTYEYRVFERRTRDAAGALREHVCTPFLARYCWDCRWPLELAAMNAAAQQLVGRHDFTSFAASDPERAARLAGGQNDAGDNTPESPPQLTAVPTNTRTVHAAGWTREGGLLIFRVRGSGFLHHMVRNLVGTLVDVGRGSLPQDAIPAILQARNRTAAGPTAPARGLFLHSVEYGERSDVTAADDAGDEPA